MYEYNAKLVRVKDGDSLVLEIDYGMYQKGEWDFRLDGVDTPEIFGKASDEEKKIGSLAKTFVEATLEKNGPILRVKTLKKSKYDYLVSIYVDVDCNGFPLDDSHPIWKVLTDAPRWQLTLTDLLIGFGHGLPYSGEKKKPWSERKVLLEAARGRWMKAT
jgi:hypothetical protein